MAKRFDAQNAIHGLDLDIEDREFVTLLGPSGCGKTTTLRLLAGLAAPDAGEIAIDGQVVSSPRHVLPPERRQMGMVFQSYALWPHMSVFENVAFGLTLKRVARSEVRERVEHALAMVGLEGFGKRTPSALSGGQQQRVALARSLVTEPSILLLDEPLSNLDAKLRERMRIELKELQRRTGITFVYVTHDQAEAMVLSDRIAVLNGGLLQQYAAPSTLYERPANRFIADFMGAANLLAGVVEEPSSPAGAPGLVRVGRALRLDALLPAGATKDKALTIMIRPEDIALARDASDRDRNILAGIVVGSNFLGSLVDYSVETDGLVLHVQVSRGTPFERGERVYLSVHPERCIGID
ncbi:MAG: ABC transporter ATP-binding protein [Sphingomonadaceae bacterium]